MYIPSWFQENDPATLHSLMRAFSFATLVTVREGAPYASHIPMLLDADRGPHGTLRAHVARANPQWEQFAEPGELLAIFQGPHGYISPSWYEVHPSVPTWNYAAVHAYGTARLLEGPALLAFLRDLTLEFEGSEEKVRAIEPPADYTEKMARAVVGFEIEITRLEGKFKLNQNRSDADRENVVAGLERTGQPHDAALAELMRERIDSQIKP